MNLLKFLFLQVPFKLRLLLYLTLASSILVAFFELFSFVAIIPFVDLVTSKELPKNYFLNQLITAFGLDQFDQIVVFLGFLLVAASLASALVKTASTYLMAFYTQDLGKLLANKLFICFMLTTLDKKYKTKLSDLLPNLFDRNTRLVKGIYNIVDSITATLVIAVIASSLVITAPLISSISLVLVSFYYLAFGFLAKGLIMRNSKEINGLLVNGYALSHQAFEGYEEISITDSVSFFASRFATAQKKMRSLMTVNSTLSNVPRYYLETVLILSVVLMLVFAYFFDAFSTTKLASSFVIFAFGIQKMLPAFQKVFSGWSKLINTKPYFNSIVSSISSYQKPSHSAQFKTCDQGLLKDIGLPSSLSYDSALRKLSAVNLELDNVSFGYPPNENHLFASFSLSVRQGDKIVLSGKSGRGKSTLLRIISLFYTPSSGVISVNGSPVHENLDLCKSFLDAIYLLPQSVFTINSTILENIVFSTREHAVDYDKLNFLLRIFCMDEFVSTLPDGICTPIGDGGVRLSGGLSQRLGLVRAFYADKLLYLLDESTSALDKPTEKIIIENINRYFGSKSILAVSHDAGSYSTFFREEII